jgi:Uma2 family endonuclease
MLGAAVKVCNRKVYVPRPATVVRQTKARNTTMATVMSPPEQRVLLHNITWDIYERLLQAHGDHSVPRLTYDQGQLELMSPSSEHEALKDTMVLLVNTLAEEMGINTYSFGSATFRREDLQRGFEPDGCFYVQSVQRIQGKSALDLTVDPPPDLVIEIDLTSPSLPKFPIFAQLGVPEVWRVAGSQVHIFALVGGEYLERTDSMALPGLTATVATRFMRDSYTRNRLAWLRQVRGWVQQGETDDV